MTPADRYRAASRDHMENGTPYPLAFCLACGEPRAVASAIRPRTAVSYECSNCSARWTLTTFRPGRTPV